MKSLLRGVKKRSAVVPAAAVISSAVALSLLGENCTPCSQQSMRLSACR